MAYAIFPTRLRIPTSGLFKYLHQPFTGDVSFSSAVVSPPPFQSQNYKTNQPEIVSQINKYCSQGRIREALDLIYAKDPSGELISSETYTSLVDCCIRVRSLKEAKRLHAHITKSGKYGPVGHRLITMYAKCQSLDDAVLVFDTQSKKNSASWNAILFAHAELGTLQQSQKIFEMIPNPNITSWNAMITACSKHGASKDALQLFNKMFYEDHLPPNSSTFTSLLNSFLRLDVVKDGMSVHCFVVTVGLESADVAWAVINMYARCGKVDEAQNVFEATPSKNVLCWAGMITACANNGRNDTAFKYFQQMLQEGWAPSLAIYIKALEACASLEHIMEGRVIHSQVMENSHETVVPAANALILLYSKCKCLEDSQKIFNTMEERDVFSWNLMIKANVDHGNYNAARALFGEMQKKGVKPNVFTFSIVLDSCITKSDLEAGESIHAKLNKYGFVSNIVVRTALVNMYAKCGNLSKARVLFNELDKKDIVLWTTMIGMYVKYGNSQEALHLFEQMGANGVKPDILTYVNALSACCWPDTLETGKQIHECIEKEGYELDSVVSTALMNMYARCGRLDLARKMFDEMQSKDVIAWTALLAVYAQLEDHKIVEELLTEMRNEGIEPNQVTYITILDACSSADALKIGKMIHQNISNASIECDAKLGAALVNMYMKCGDFEGMKKTLDGISQWNADLLNLALEAYVQNGLNKEAIELFEQKSSSVKPDKVTFVHLLSACRNASLVSEGRLFFESVMADFRVLATGEHFTCMVELLAKSGHLEEAESLIRKMPGVPSTFVWMTLLNACEKYDDVERGERVAKQILDVDASNTEAYQILACMQKGSQISDNIT